MFYFLYIAILFHAPATVPGALARYFIRLQPAKVVGELPKAGASRAPGPGPGPRTPGPGPWARALGKGPQARARFVKGARANKLGRPQRARTNETDQHQKTGDTPVGKETSGAKIQTPHRSPNARLFF